MITRTRIMTPEDKPFFRHFALNEFRILLDKLTPDELLAISDVMFRGSFKDIKKAIMEVNCETVS